MITGFYFLLLLMASVEDYRSHTVKSQWVFLVWVLGIINIVLYKENRWVTVTLTCICFLVLWLVYLLVKRAEEPALNFGGADVKLIPAMMLVQGWDMALAGVFLGLFLSLVYYLMIKKMRKDIPLVPWMTAGCFLVEIIYLFSGKSVL